MTPLMSAVISGRLECVEFLLSKGASVLCKDNEGWTALHYASSTDHKDVLQAMISSLPSDHRSVDIPRDCGGETPLMVAAERGALRCAELLLASGASELTRDIESRTAAHYAAYHGHGDVLEFLLRRTSWQVYDPKNACITLLEEAVTGGQVEIVHQLHRLEVPVFHGAAVARRGLMLYWKCLQTLIEEQKGKDPVPMARLLCKLYAAVCPEWALWWRKKQLNGLDTLRAAIATSNVPLVEILLDAGFDVNAPQRDGQRPLSAGIQAGNDEIIQLLRRRGAKE